MSTSDGIHESSISTTSSHSPKHHKMKPFSSAAPISKQLFLSSYKKITILSHLLTAPFGIADHIIDVMGDEMIVHELTPIYRSWEEVLTRRVYYGEGIVDEAVAATLNQYISKEEDPIIIQELQQGSQAVHILASPSRIIEFPASMISKDQDHITSCHDMLLDPCIIAGVVDKVFKALGAVFAGGISELRSRYPIDAGVLEAIPGLHVSCRKLQPVEFNAAPLAMSTLSSASLSMLLDAFNIISPDTSASHMLSIDQYYCLLRMYGRSQEVQQVLSSFLNHQHDTHMHMSGCMDVNATIDMLSYAGLYYIQAIPCLSVMMEVDTRLLSTDNDGACVDKNMQRYDMMLHQMKRMQEKKNKAQDLRNESSCIEALHMIQRLFKDKHDYDDDGDEADDDNDDDIDIDDDGMIPYDLMGIPAQLVAEVYVERAHCKMCVVDEDAADPTRTRALILGAVIDCNRAIDMDDRCADAYAIRAQALSSLAMISSSSSSSLSSSVAVKDVVHDIISGQKLSSDILHMTSTHDILTAFVLGGSSDVTLATSAEESVREACRAQAKAIYQTRIMMLQHPDTDISSSLSSSSSSSWMPPKPWLIKSFFAGYELLSDAMMVLPLPLQTNKPSSSSSYDHTNDIDEDSITQQVYPRPPDHLLDHQHVDGRSSSSLSSSVLRDEDAYAYLLLQMLVEIFDAYLDDDHQDNDSKTHDDDGDKYDDDKDVTMISSSSSCLDEISSMMASCRLVDVGVADIIDDDAIESSSHHKNPVHVSASHDDTSSSSSSPSCNPVVRALHLLSSEQAMHITGFRFNHYHIDADQLTSSSSSSSSFLVKSIAPARKHDNKDDDEEDDDDDWVDCNDEDDEEEEEVAPSSNVEGVADTCNDKPCVSHGLRARLLNLCSAICYMCGDAAAAVQCLRIAIAEDRDVLDNYLKLGALLIDMDEPDEAASLFRKMEKRFPDDPYLLLHQAELSIHSNDFPAASRILSQAYRITCDATATSTSSMTNFASYQRASQLIVSNGNHASLEQQQCIEQRRYDALIRLQANIACLRGVTAFRLHPNQPEDALRILQRAQQQIEAIHTSSSSTAAGAHMFLLLSLGDITCQAGDVVAGLQLFAQAAAADPSHPMPYANAARAYQQLQQHSLAEYHLELSLACDPSLAMTYVDMAQGQSLAGRVEAALRLLDTAMTYAKHVSEIRDVLTARTVTAILCELQQQGIYHPPVDTFP